MKAFIYLAEGFEEIEALAVCDVLRRGGVETILVKVSTDGDNGLCHCHTATPAAGHPMPEGQTVNAAIGIQAIQGAQASQPHKCLTVKGSHGIKVKGDIFLEEMLTETTDKKDIMVFPGGMPGSKRLAECRPLIEAMKEHYKNGGLLAAICAAPGLVLGQLQIPSDTEFTCYDGFEEPLKARGGKFRPTGAITSNRITTGRGPAYAVEFGLEILRQLIGPAAEDVRKGMFLE